MKRRILAGIAACSLAFTLAACSNDADDSSVTPSSGSASTSEPEVVLSDKGMPSVEFDSEGIPSLVFPGSGAPEAIQVAVLEEGTGREIARTDWVKADYVGAVWGSGESFDTSFTQDSPLVMSLGRLVEGWAYGLEGRHVGDKVILSIPSDWGYGDEGAASGGIQGGDTIVFYIEVLDAWDVNAAGDADAGEELSSDELPVQYEARIGEPITSISVKDGVDAPVEQATRVIARGSGAPIEMGDIVYYQVAQTYWDNSTSLTTWQNDVGEAYGISGNEVAEDTIFADLVGIPVGSRVLLEIPSSVNEEAEVPAVAAVMDFLAVGRL